MLDLFFGEKLFSSVMSNPKIKNKFRGYFWRAALIIAGSYGRGISSGLRPGGIYARGTDALRSDDSHSDCRDPYCFDCHSHRAVFSVARREEKVAFCRSIKRQFLATHSPSGYSWGLAPKKPGSSRATHSPSGYSWGLAPNKPGSSRATHSPSGYSWGLAPNKIKKRKVPASKLAVPFSFYFTRLVA